ncbi:hypothetical protein P153DRAFT_365842 [Dothidotthia symphoricarpi CBS 119687]|uniref:Uncharacterized protein n=1 Tax=Dothidotthia symphoricarpi CBS 119687 TaxID=1392245 RepID=A0A6A6AFZ7_9PLEO|nr:uncharacterized protein P153DRAFT_365842 [Dothidotthia symphoricarpi CBS 119687]KAF2130203.1 hypothetical protein P153DRAFT_365842 [Dothidotthia symphoricarpi CBS 119687]
MPYNRDVVVNCVKRHYDLLIRAAYLDANIVQNPPPEGWSDDQLAVDLLQAFGRSDKVIDLLRHLPYLNSSIGIGGHEIYIETRSISYLHGSDILEDLTVEACREDGLSDALLMPLPGDWPPSFISLTHGGDAIYWVIDTDQGIIYPMDSYLVDDTAPEEQPWLGCAKPRDIQEFFDELYDEMESLKTVPVPKGEASWYHEVLPCEFPKGEIASRLLREYGWPNALRTEEYLEAVRKVHPDNVRR